MGWGEGVLLNAAAWVAFWVWLTGRADQSWSKVAYDAPRPAPAPATPPMNDAPVPAEAEAARVNA